MANKQSDRNAQIEAFIKARGVTVCPPAVPVEIPLYDPACGYITITVVQPDPTRSTR